MKTTVERGDLGLMLYADRFGGVVLCEEGLRLSDPSVCICGDFVRMVGSRARVASGLEDQRLGITGRKSFALAEKLLLRRQEMARGTGN